MECELAFELEQRLDSQLGNLWDHVLAQQWDILWVWMLVAVKVTTMDVDWADKMVARSSDRLLESRSADSLEKKKVKGLELMRVHMWALSLERELASLMALQLTEW